jgi:hypothetical protein
MASTSKKTKTDSAPKDVIPKESAPKDAAPKDAASKADTAAKVESPAAEAAPKSDGGETTGKPPSNYSRGEGQKPVTAAYKENWDAIFAKKAKKKKR